MSADELIEYLLGLRKTSQHPSPFAVLGIDAATSSPEIVRAAYKARSLVLHPDKNANPAANAAFHILSNAYDELKSTADPAGLALSPSPSNVSLSRQSSTSSLDRNSESYQQYDHQCSAMLDAMKRRQAQRDAVPNGRKRKDVSPVRSANNNSVSEIDFDLDLRDKDEQSCEEDSFECFCGEEKCTCRAPGKKRARADQEGQDLEASTTQNDMMNLEDPKPPGPLVQVQPACHFGVSQIFSHVMSKFYEFIDCTPLACPQLQPSSDQPHPTQDSLPTNNSDPNSSNNSATSAPTLHPPFAAVKCHGVGLFNFLKSSNYAQQLSARGFCNKGAKTKKD